MYHRPKTQCLAQNLHLFHHYLNCLNFLQMYQLLYHLAYHQYHQVHPLNLYCLLSFQIQIHRFQKLLLGFLQAHLVLLHIYQLYQTEPLFQLQDYCNILTARHLLKSKHLQLLQEVQLHLLLQLLNQTRHYQNHQSIHLFSEAFHPHPYSHLPQYQSH